MRQSPNWCSTCCSQSSQTSRLMYAESSDQHPAQLPSQIQLAFRGPTLPRRETLLQNIKGHLHAQRARQQLHQATISLLPPPPPPALQTACDSSASGGASVGEGAGASTGVGPCESEAQQSQILPSLQHLAQHRLGWPCEPPQQLLHDIEDVEAWWDQVVPAVDADLQALQRQMLLCRQVGADLPLQLRHAVSLVLLLYSI